MTRAVQRKTLLIVLASSFAAGLVFVTLTAYVFSPQRMQKPVETPAKAENGQDGLPMPVAAPGEEIEYIEPEEMEDALE